MPFIVALLSTFLLSGCLPEKTDPTSSSIQIEAPYAFATLPGAATGAAFMVIKNTGLDDELIAANSMAANITEIHQNLIDPDDSTMMMRKIKAIDIPAKGEAILEPTGYHVMFIQLKSPLTIGLEVPITLTFEKAGDIEVKANIIAPGTKP